MMKPVFVMLRGGIMTREKLVAVLEDYRAKFEQHGIPAKQLNESNYIIVPYSSIPEQRRLEHAHYMTCAAIQRLGDYSDGPQAMEKAFRWLGWIQRELCNTFYSVTNVKEHSRSED